VASRIPAVEIRLAGAAPHPADVNYEAFSVFYIQARGPPLSTDMVSVARCTSEKRHYAEQRTLTR